MMDTFASNYFKLPSVCVLEVGSITLGMLEHSR